jgi:hypothetical protein
MHHGITALSRNFTLYTNEKSVWSPLI